MDTFVFTLLFVAELIALVIVLDLWLNERMHILLRMFWTFFLLVPFLGLLMFVFIKSDLDYNPDKTDTGSDSDAFGGGGGLGL